MNLKICFALTLLFPFSIHAQENSTEPENNKWYFGLNFNVDLRNRYYPYLVYYGYNYYDDASLPITAEVVLRKRITEFPIHLLLKSSYSQHVLGNSYSYYYYEDIIGPPYYYYYQPYYYFRKASASLGLQWDYLKRKKVKYAINLHNSFIAGYENHKYLSADPNYYYYYSYDTVLYEYNTSTKVSEKVSVLNFSLLSGVSLTYKDKVEIGAGFEVGKSFAVNDISGTRTYTNTTSVVDTTSFGNYYYRQVSQETSTIPLDEIRSFRDWLVRFYLGFGIRF